MQGRLPRTLNKPLTRHFICDSCLSKLSISNLSQRRSTSQRALKREAEVNQQWVHRALEIKQGERQSLLSLLEDRGLLQSVVGERKDLDRALSDKEAGAYVGIDPTAPSLHVGHMVTLMPLFWLYGHGYKAFTLLGGSTASIGDPTGRTTSRSAMSSDVRRTNSGAMHMQLKRLWVLAEKHLRRQGYIRESHWRRGLVDNGEWWRKLLFYDVMRELGEGSRIGPMLGRDNVKTRLESGDGMSFAEFAYPLMQTWDWWELYQQQGIQIQIGGSDQYGNILTGVEGIKHMTKRQSQPKGKVVEQPIGFTVPLLTTAKGEKFGKSAGNAVWLSEDLTSTFELYQYFLRQPDSDMERLLKMFTFIPLTEISSIITEHQKSPSQRFAQHRLAREFVELVHGEDGAKHAEAEHRLLFSGKLPLPSSSQDGKLKTLAVQIPPHHVSIPHSMIGPNPFSRILVAASLATSRSEAERMITQGSVSVGARADREETSDHFTFHPITKDGISRKDVDYIINGDLIILRVGKWKLKIIKIVRNEEFVQRHSNSES